MKWDILIKIYDVIWSDVWLLKYRLCTYMRIILLNMNWQLCDMKMKWSMYINVLLWNDVHIIVMNMMCSKEWILKWEFANFTGLLNDVEEWY